jgi:serine phosphatase RsbU (regulator of sigma subunit)
VTKAPSYLRLYREQVPAPPTATAAQGSRLNPLCRAFEQATGWALRHREGAPGDGCQWSAALDATEGETRHYLEIEASGPPGEADSRLPFERAIDLATELANLAKELWQVEQALYQREAELATGVPVVAPRRQDGQLSRRLEAILRGGAEAIGCVAAGLYLLDAATTELSLRSAWNLPRDRFTRGPRPLQGAMADLEALCGHAVTIEDAALDATWNAPEPFAAFVCVPVSSAGTPLGTLWLFAERSRRFTDAEANVAEIVAGRLAAELERESVVAQQVETVSATRQLNEAQSVQQNQLPQIAPLVDGWTVAGTSRQAGSLGGSFHDWLPAAGERLLVASGQGMHGGIAGALAASGLRATLRSQAQYQRFPAKLLERLNHALWTGSAGDQYASLVCGVVEPASGDLLVSAAGPCVAMLVGPERRLSLVEPSLALGRQPLASYSAGETRMARGEIAILGCAAFESSAKSEAFAGELLAAIAAEHLSEPADEIIERLRAYLQAAAAGLEYSLAIVQYRSRR